MALIPLAIQLYTVRDQIVGNVARELKKIADIGYIGVEIGGFSGLKPEEFHKLVSEAGLVVSAAWPPFPTEENIASIIDDYGRFGIKHFVTSSGPNDVRTVDDCKRTGERFQEAAALVKEHGYKLAIHNHWWEFEKLPDGALPQDIIVAEAPDAVIQLDTYWAAISGPDPAEFARRHRSRVELLHVKDGVFAADRSMVPLGQGKLNFPDIVAALDPAVTKWLALEIDTIHTDLDEAIRDSYNYMIGSGLAAGNRQV